MIPTAGPHPVGDQPQITLTTPLSTVAGAFVVTVRSTVKLNNFTVNKIEFTNCTLSTFTQITKQYFTFVATPVDEGTVSLSILPGVCFSPGGKANLPSNELNIIYNEGEGGASDYLGSLYDEWVANRGYAGTTTTVVGTWNGYRSERVLTQSGNIAPPANAIQPIDGTNDIFRLSTASNPGISGASSVSFLIRKTSATAGAVTLFDTNTNTPRFKCMLRISAGNTHMGLSYNGTIHDCGSAFTYDSNFHVLTFVVDGANNVGAIWLDGSQVGSDFTLTGGGLNANTGQELYFFRQTSAASEFFGGDVKKIRIYSEYLSDDNIALLSTGDFSDDITDATPLIFTIGLGQSNNAPPDIGAAYSPENNNIENYPAELQGDFDEVYYWYSTSNTNVFLPLTGTALGNPGHILKEAYDLRVKHPTYHIRVMREYKSATGFTANSGTAYWDAAIAANSTYRNNIRPKIVNAYFNLNTIEQRNIDAIYVVWNQWENEAGATEARANQWEAKMQEMIDDLRSVLGSDIVIILIGANTRSSLEFKQILIDAQDNLVTSDPTHIKKVDTENITYFPYLGGLVHYGVTGEVNLGSNIRGTVQFM